MVDRSKAEKVARDEVRRLWDIEKTPRPGPKTPHTARSIAKEGIALADAEGLQALSMRLLAERLSMSAMALYNHFPGKAELLAVMVDEVASELLDARPGGWRQRAEAVAWSNWNCFLRHPWLIAVESYRPVIGPNVLAKYEVELGVFDGLGLSDIEMDFALNSMLGLVRGCVAVAIDANGLLRKKQETDLEWWQIRQPILEKLKIAERFPLASKVGGAIGDHSKAPQSPEDNFQFGLDRWLQGMSNLPAIRSVGE